MPNQTANDIKECQDELEKLYQQKNELQKKLAKYQEKQQQIERQQQAALRAQERSVNSIQRRRGFAKRYGDQFQRGIMEESRKIVTVVQHSGALTNAASELSQAIKKVQLQLEKIKVDINRLEQKSATLDVHPGDMPLSKFNTQKKVALSYLMQFMFVEKRTQPGEGYRSYDRYGFDRVKDILDPKNLDAARGLITEYHRNSAAVHKNHQIIVQALSILLSNTPAGRIPANCCNQMEKLNYDGLFEGGRRNVLELAKNAMSYDEKTAALTEKEPSAMQFYQIQEWMVQVLVKNYLARRWELHKNDGEPDQNGFIQITDEPENQKLERVNDDCLGLYNFFRSRSKSEARREHALETIQLIRQATNVNELIEHLMNRIKSNQKGYFSHSSSSHSLDENYRILITIADYANQTTEKTEWNASSAIEDWQDQCLQDEFNGYCGLFATHAYGLKS